MPSTPTRLRPRPVAAAACLGAVALALGVPHARADDARVALPAALASAIADRFPGAIVDEVDMEEDLGLVVYDVELDHDDREVEVEGLADGTLLTLETDTRVARMPAAARAALPSHLRHGRIEAERIEVFHGLGGSPGRVLFRVGDDDDGAWFVAADGQAWGPLPDGDDHDGRDSRGEGRHRDGVGHAADDDRRSGGGEARRDDRSVIDIADVRRGRHVSLRGEVERVRDEDTFVLRDGTGSVRVYIGWRNAMPVRRGDVVTVHGKADDDALPGRRPEVYADRLVVDGESVRLRSD